VPVSAADTRVGAQAERVHPGLGGDRGRVFAQGAPPALREGVVAFLHRPFAVAVPRGADVDADPVMLRDGDEGGGDLAGGWVADGGHPVEAPPLRDPTQALAQLAQARDQVRLVLGLGQHHPPRPGVTQCSDQQVRVPGQSPRGRGVGQLEPVELGFRPRWVGNDRVIEAAHPSQCGRSARDRKPRVKLGYDPA